MASVNWKQEMAFHVSRENSRLLAIPAWLPLCIQLNKKINEENLSCIKVIVPEHRKLLMKAYVD